MCDLCFLGMNLNFLFNSCFINMKYIGLCAFMILFLSSCFWSDETEDRGLIEESVAGLSLSVPNSWEQVSSSSLPLPNAGEIVFASQSRQEKSWYFNNLVILKEENTNAISSQALIKNNMSFLKQNMRSFSLISEKNISFLDEEAGSILIFSGRYNLQTPEVVYLQTARSCPEWNFLLTLSIWEKLENYEQYEYILQTLTCD